MRGKRRNKFALLLGLLLLFCQIASAYALNLDKDCSLNVDFSNPQEFSDIRDDLVADIYQIAVMEAGSDDDSFTLKPNPPYAGRGLVFEGEMDSDTKPNWNALAQVLAKLILADESVQTDPYRLDVPLGESLEKTPAGLYLVFVHKEGAPCGNYVTFNGSICTTAESDEFEYRFAPILVSVPYFDDKDTHAWVYDATAYLKPQQDRKDTPDIRIEKTAKGEPSRLLPGAKFAVYASVLTEHSSEADTIETYVQGVGPVTLYRYMVSSYQADEYGYCTTDSEGKISFKRTPDLPAYTLFALVEIDPPAGYQRLEEPIFFYAEENFPTESFGVTVLEDGVSVTGGIKREFYDGGSVQGYTYTLPTLDSPALIRAYISTNGSFGTSPGWTPTDEFGCYEYFYTGEEDPLTLLVSNDESVNPFNVSVFFEMQPMSYGPDGPEYRDEWLPYPDSIQYTAQGRVLSVDDDGDYLLAIENEPDLVDLPAAGGMGTAAFACAGGLMLTCALCLLLMRRRNAVK